MIPSPEPRLCILVVEDENIIRELAAEVLVDKGYEVLEAANGADALALVDDGAAVDVLFTDVNMPGEPDGIALAEAVCARRPQIRLIVASGRPFPVSTLPCSGRFLSKPYPLLQLGRLIQEVTR